MFDQRGIGGVGGTHYYLMIGRGASLAYHHWIVFGSPDPTAAQWTGGDTPLTNVYVDAEWIF